MLVVTAAELQQTHHVSALFPQPPKLTWEDEEDVDEDAHDSEVKVASLRAVEVQNCSSVVESGDNQEEQKRVDLPRKPPDPMGSVVCWQRKGM
ncbi:hypothetical protein GH733_013641 [Mirounga leonina]|nr:hypothetical protein GH733_013641 [Mirounga leonina]